MAHSSINKHDVDWRREWDDEQQLTPEELRLQKLEQEEAERIGINQMEDMLACTSIVAPIAVASTGTGPCVAEPTFVEEGPPTICNGSCWRVIVLGSQIPIGGDRCLGTGGCWCW